MSYYNDYNFYDKQIAISRRESSYNTTTIASSGFLLLNALLFIAHVHNVQQIKYKAH